jgi:alpha-glucosidase
VDGFRIDVAHLVGKEVPTGPDAESPFAVPGARTHEIMRGLRQLADSYPGDRVLVGETYIMSTRAVAEFYGAGDELHLAFNFTPLYAPWSADAWRKRIDRAHEEFDPIDAWPTWVLSNHDNPRHRTRYGSEARARAACLLLLGLRGAPFLYAGEELGLEDAAVPRDRVVDPGGRDACRAPIPWEPGPNHGWPTERPWLPWPAARDAATQERDPTSFLHLYRQALAIRRASAALRDGTFMWHRSPQGVLAWERRAPDDRKLVVVNMTDRPVDLSTLVGEEWRVELSSDGTSGRRLAGSAAVWLGS